jgi:UDP-arabinose 4-epimerase
MSKCSDTVLVTGGAGYIGSHTCKALANVGFRPIAVDNLVHGHEWAVKWGPLERGDISDRTFLDAVMVRYRPAAILHFAAYAHVGESVTDPARYYRNNVVGTLNLLEAMRAHGIGILIFSSTCATYGVPRSVPIDESVAQSPINPYGASKLMVERMLADFEAAHGLRSTSLRYFNAAGADPEGELGELRDHETHLIPLALDAVSGRGPVLRVFGSDYPTPDGTCIRDYVHVTDLAEAHIAALVRLIGGGASDAFNLGSGKGASALEVIKAVERVTGRRLPYRMAPRREGDPPLLVSTPFHAARELGWAPGISDLDTIVRTAWRWHQWVESGRLTALSA